MHLSWDALELYVLRRSSAEAFARTEEHLLVCRSCRETLEQVQAYVDLLRRGLVELEGLIELHACPGGIVGLRVYRSGLRWVGRVCGADLDTGISSDSEESAAAQCRAMFREMFPDHTCGPTCKTF